MKKYWEKTRQVEFNFSEVVKLMGDSNVAEWIKPAQRGDLERAGLVATVQHSPIRIRLTVRCIEYFTWNTS